MAPLLHRAAIIKDEKSAAKFHYIKTVSGKVAAQSIAFRVASIYWQAVASFPWYLNAKGPTPIGSTCVAHTSPHSETGDIFHFGYGRDREDRFWSTFGYGRNYNEHSMWTETVPVSYSLHPPRLCSWHLWLSQNISAWLDACYVVRSH